MSVFICSKCAMMENTALCHYWSRDFVMPDGSPPQPPLCSQCDPAIGKWHGKFERVPLPADHVIGPDGFVHLVGDKYLARLLEEEKAKKIERDRALEDRARQRRTLPLLAALAGLAADAAPVRPAAGIPFGYVCSACGGASHTPECRPPRGLRKVHGPA